MGATKGLGNPLTLRLRGRLSRLGLGTRTESGGTELQGEMPLGLGQRLGVCVGTDELHAQDLSANHVVHRVAARTTDPDYLDHGAQGFCF